MAAFEYRQAVEIGETFNRRDVRYLFIGNPLVGQFEFVAGKDITNRR